YLENPSGLSPARATAAWCRRLLLGDGSLGQAVQGRLRFLGQPGVWRAAGELLQELPGRRRTEVLQYLDRPQVAPQFGEVVQLQLVQQGQEPSVDLKGRLPFQGL